MKLREAYDKCKRAYGTIDFYYNSLVQSSKNTDFNKKASLQEFNVICDSCYEFAKEELGEIPFISSCLEYIEECMACERRDIDSLAGAFFILYQRVQCILSLYESTIYPVDEELGLDIKIPKTDNLTDLKKYIDGLEFIFSKCPFFQNSEASLKLKAVENGSILLLFGIAASLAVGSVFLNNIAAFIDKCFVIRSHKLTCEMQKQMVKNAEMDEKEKEEIIKSVDKLYKVYVQKTIKELEEDTGYQIRDGDERGRAEQSMEKMERLLDKGVQIYSSINSPEEIKAVFAPIEMRYLEIEKGLKQIEEKIDMDSE